MKHILLPTDFSENAWNAITYALQLFKDEACSFYLLNSYEETMSAPSSGVTSHMLRDSLYKAQKERSSKGLEDVLLRIENSLSNELHTFVTLSVYDVFYSAVKNNISTYNIDYVVMGTKGASALKEMTIGSNTAGLIGKISCPIIAVPSAFEYKPMKEIAFATDYEVSYNMKGLNPLIELIDMTKSSVSIVYINEHNKALTDIQATNYQTLREILISFSTGFYTLTDLKVATGVKAFVESRNIDLLCVIAKKHDFLTRLLIRSHSKLLSNQTNIPILILNTIDL